MSSGAPTAKQELQCLLAGASVLVAEQGTLTAPSLASGVVVNSNGQSNRSDKACQGNS